MSNSFNIDVKPEIAAVAADIAANLVQILSNASSLGTIQTTALPGLATQNTNIQSAVDAIADPQLPDILTAIGNNATAIATIDGIVNDILVDTAAMPQNVRGQCLFARLSTTLSEFQEVANVTGHGKLSALAASCGNDADTVEVRITIDGAVWELYSHTGDTLYQAIFPYSETSSVKGHIVSVPSPQTEPRLFDIEFKTSLLIEVRRSAGTTAAVVCKLFYTLDAF